jgi:hypothetical protein
MCEHHRPPVSIQLKIFMKGNWHHDDTRDANRSDDRGKGVDSQERCERAGKMVVSTCSKACAGCLQSQLKARRTERSDSLESHMNSEEGKVKAESIILDAPKKLNGRNQATSPQAAKCPCCPHPKLAKVSAGLSAKPVRSREGSSGIPAYRHTITSPALHHSCSTYTLPKRSPIASPSPADPSPSPSPTQSHSSSRSETDADNPSAR